MLVLSRREKERVILFIGDERIHIDVIQAGKNGGVVRLGISAPDWVKILRAELEQEPEDQAA